MVEILDVTNTGRRRRFSLAEKIRIVEESLSGPKLARATARRYGIALSGLYQWRGQVAKLNGIDPQAWLVDVIAKISDLPLSRLHELLPWQQKPLEKTAVKAA